MKNDVREMRDEAKDTVYSMKGMARDVTDHLSEKATDVMNSASEYAQAGKKNLEKQVKRNPSESMMIAAGLGLVLGFIIGRR